MAVPVCGAWVSTSPIRLWSIISGKGSDNTRQLTDHTALSLPFEVLHEAVVVGLNYLSQNRISLKCCIS